MLRQPARVVDQVPAELLAEALVDREEREGVAVEVQMLERPTGAMR
jgi:hypothetical protein